MELSDRQFGAWVALAIHDTASVVGAASSVGDIAVEVAATLKVARTIWIVPLVLFAGWLYRSKSEGFGLPLFVVFFIAAVLLNSFFEPDALTMSYLKDINRFCLITGLFCIGTQINIDSLKLITARPSLVACLVWVMIIPTSFWIVQGF